MVLVSAPAIINILIFFFLSGRSKNIEPAVLGSNHYNVSDSHYMLFVVVDPIAGQDQFNILNKN